MWIHKHIECMLRRRNIEISRPGQASPGLDYGRAPLCTLNGVRLEPVRMCFACKWGMMFGLTAKRVPSVFVEYHYGFLLYC